MVDKQVDSHHYKFNKYVHKKRWISIWHQVDEVLGIQPSSLLEVGPGSGLFKSIVRSFGINVDTVDLDPDLNPDYVASVTNLPFDCGNYDCVCAFQVLEHLPYKESLKAFDELVRVSKRYILQNIEYLIQKGFRH